jgi:hypothetical protein
MDLSSIRNALNEFSTATPVYPQMSEAAGAEAFLLGADAPALPAQLAAMIDLNAPPPQDVLLVDDFTQSDGLEIDYPCGQPEPVISLCYNPVSAATEVRLDGVCVAAVQMRQGHGPLRASAIRLIPDLGLAAQMGAA